MSADGPLAFLSFPAQMCVARFPHPGGYGHGHEVLENTGDEPLTITAVDLKDAKGIAVSDVRSFRIAERGIHGVLRGWSQDDDSLPPLLDGTLAPGERTNLVARLDPTTGATSASLQGVTVSYTAGGEEFSETSFTRVRFERQCPA